MNSYWYRAYNLNIRSTIYLPELFQISPDNPLNKNGADVLIRYGDLPVKSLWSHQSTEEFRYTQTSSEGINVFWEGVGTFLIRDGKEIIVDPLPGIPEEVQRLFILGTSLALLMHQRHELAIMHASGVAIGDKAVAFVGNKGDGKSTMAVALHTCGYNLLTDDILALDTKSPVPLAIPGTPHCKLWPDAIESLGYKINQIPKLRSDGEKRGFRVTDERFALDSIPLKGIYLLAPGSVLEIKQLNPQLAFWALMPHWYGARFGPELLQALGVETHFTQCATLARQVPVFLLRRPTSLAHLSKVARLVEQHVLAQSFGIESQPVKC